MKRFIIYFSLLIIIFSCAKIKITPQNFKSTNPPSNWTMYGGSIYRTNVYNGKISSPLKLTWKFKASSAIGKTILAVDGILYFNTMDGRIYALKIKNGKKIGHKKINVDATIAYCDTNLIIAYRYGDETLFLYDLQTAKTLWKVDAGDISSEPLIIDSAVVITALYQHIDLYALGDGVKIWQAKTAGQIHSSPAFDGVSIIVFGCDDNYVYAVSKLDGKIIWKFKTMAGVLATPAIKDSVVYVGSSDKNFYALNIKTGNLIWKFQTRGQVLHAAAVTDQFVVFGTTDSRLYCLDRITGEKKWAFTAKSVVSTSPLVCEQTVFIGSLDHHYYALELNSGKLLWKYKTEGRVKTTPVIWGNYLIGASENNIVYAFSYQEDN